MSRCLSVGRDTRLPRAKSCQCFVNSSRREYLSELEHGSSSQDFLCSSFSNESNFSSHLKHFQLFGFPYTGLLWFARFFRRASHCQNGHEPRHLGMFGCVPVYQGSIPFACSQDRKRFRVCTTFRLTLSSCIPSNDAGS